jgi:hypothetical protein
MAALCAARFAGRSPPLAAPHEPSEPQPLAAVKRLLQAPNLMIATLWADQLGAAGIEATVQRAFASGIAGEIPPDQSLPEVWIIDDAQLERARTLIDEWRHPPHHHWRCPRCGETVDGPFEQCWNCGTGRP